MPIFYSFLAGHRGIPEAIFASIQALEMLMDEQINFQGLL